MKYCDKCGNQLLDEAVMCPKCGGAVGNQHNPVEDQKAKKTASNAVWRILCLFGGIGIIIGTMIWIANQM